MPKSALASFAVAVTLSLLLSACKDTKTLQENEQLKTQVAQLQKENGQIGNELETVTAARDALAKENETLKAELRTKHMKRSAKTSSSRRRHRSQRASGD